MGERGPHLGALGGLVVANRRDPETRENPGNPGNPGFPGRTGNPGSPGNPK